MTSLPTASCSHELRPGTAVCLRCQHAERAATRARQRRAIARGGAAVLLVGVIAAVGIAAATTWRGRASSAPLGLSLRSPDPTTTTADSAGEDAIPSAAATETPAARTAAAVPSARPFSPVIPMGRTALRDTMIAERAGDTVRVRFDLLMSRTRRPDKFEAIVRATLPQVYGAPADSALQALPVGAVARAGDLTTALTERGFQIPLADGRTIAVWPETREGRDGPLVVAYRALASR